MCAGEDRTATITTCPQQINLLLSEIECSETVDAYSCTLAVSLMGLFFVEQCHKQTEKMIFNDYVSIKMHHAMKRPHTIKASAALLGFLFLFHVFVFTSSR